MRRFFLMSNARPVPGRLHPLEQPLADLDVADVHELDADRAAVRRPQDRDQLAQRALTALGEPVVENPVHVGVGQAKRRRLEEVERLAPRVELERVEVCQVMAGLAIGVDQPRDGRLCSGRRGDARTVGPRRPGLTTQIVSFKKDAPRAVDRGGIAFPAVVVLLDDVQIPAVRDCRTFHGVWVSRPAVRGRWGCRLFHSKRGATTRSSLEDS